MADRKYKREVYCTFQFEAWHNWPDAPKEVDFLRYRHRHIFHVKAYSKVSHNDRDVEFITLKKELTHVCHDWSGTDLGAMSCEMIAEEILNEFDCLYMVEVSEDGENGAIVRFGDRNEIR